MRLKTIAIAAMVLLTVLACSSGLSNQSPNGLANQSSPAVQVEQQKAHPFSPNSGDVKQLLATKQCQGCNLKGADLSKADLKGADLQAADLRGANLNHANLNTSNLIQADLREANLSQANLEGAKLTGAQLRNED